MKRPLVITPGDPRGIGPEVTCKALRSLGIDAIVLGDLDALSPWGGDAFPRVEEIGAVEGIAACAPPPGDEAVEVRAIRAAVAACVSGRARGLVTGPIHKGRLVKGGFRHRGHTDFLGALCGVEHPVMAFVGGEVRVALATVHIPVADVAKRLTTARIVETAMVSTAALRRDLGLPEPRVLVCGLNPHAGDDGAIGDEDRRVVAPAVAELVSAGVRASGPHSSETAFRRALAGNGDIVIAMYHDQGLLPLKVLGALEGSTPAVNWTLGLPFVRTSVDHGTADDIAGKGVADPSSMAAAIRLGMELSAQRSSNSKVVAQAL